MIPPENAPDISRLLALKRYEQPPPGFANYLRGRIMREIAEEQVRLTKPWWSRFFEELTWQRGMVAANALAFAGVAFLAAATFQLAHSVENEEIEAQVYAALPLPSEVLNRAAANSTSAPAGLASSRAARILQPLPSNGGAVIDATFNLSAEPAFVSTNDAPKWLFDTPSAANPRFTLARDRR